MNSLVIGLDKAPLLDQLPERFLIVDDGPLIDELPSFSRKSVTVFNPQEHSFNPLKDMNYLRSREFWDVLKAIYPEGEDTLTKAAAEYQILSALQERPKSLQTLVSDTKDTQYAYQMVAKLLLSPVLRDVLTRPTNMSFKGTIIARLDRAVLGDFDCFVLANLLISQYQGHVIVPDFGFYQCPSHTMLLRQERLSAGIYSFEEFTTLRQQMLLIEDKVPSRCTPADAKLLGVYAGLIPGTTGYNDFIIDAITG